MSINLKNILTFLSVLLAGLLLAVSRHIIFNPIKEAKEKEATLNVLSNYFSGVTDFESNTLETKDGVEITASLRAYKGEEPLGYLYESNIQNSFGNMKIRLVVSVRDVIDVAEFIELNQTMYQTQTTNNLQTYVLQKLNSENMYDASAGVTSISVNDLAHMIYIVAQHHDSTDKFDVILPYAEFYGSEYVVSETSNSTVEGASVKKEVIENQGIVYTITKSGIYQSGNVTEKEITLVIALDNEDNILGVLLPLESYNHTKGNFYNDALSFAQSFAGKDITNLLDGQTGATDDVTAFNSRSLIESMVMIVKAVHTA